MESWKAKRDGLLLFAGMIEPKEQALVQQLARIARYVIDDVQDPEAAPVRKLIVHEIEAPAGVSEGLNENRRTRSNPPGAGIFCLSRSGPLRGRAGRCDCGPVRGDHGQALVLRLV